MVEMFGKDGNTDEIYRHYFGLRRGCVSLTAVQADSTISAAPEPRDRYEEPWICHTLRPNQTQPKICSGNSS